MARSIQKEKKISSKVDHRTVVESNPEKARIRQVLRHFLLLLVGVSTKRPKTNVVSDERSVYSQPSETKDSKIAASNKGPHSLTLPLQTDIFCCNSVLFICRKGEQT